MGTLRYAGNSFEIDDTTLFHLDVIISRCRIEGLSFQFHITLGGEDDYDLISITLSPYTELFMKYSNSERTLNSELVIAALNRIRETGMISIENVTTRIK